MRRKWGGWLPFSSSRPGDLEGVERKKDHGKSKVEVSQVEEVDMTRNALKRGGEWNQPSCIHPRVTWYVVTGSPELAASASEWARIESSEMTSSSNVTLERRFDTKR